MSVAPKDTRTVVQTADQMAAVKVVMWAERMAAKMAAKKAAKKADVMDVKMVVP